MNSAAGAQLHSRYNPQAEAERYINSLNLKNSLACFILIEPGEGYIIPVLRQKFYNSKIIVLHADNTFKACDERHDVPANYSCSSLEIERFLEKELPDTDASLIRIIEWRPSLNYYKEDYLSLLSHAAQYLKRMQAGKRTTEAFGRRWVRNFFKNLKIINKTILYKEADIPVIITGSGPSLENAMEQIKKIQDNCLVIAASSSVSALWHNGIKADIVIATDGGNWALHHIYPCYRNERQANIFAANLCAALPSQCAASAFLIINDGSFWQSVILHDLNLASVIIPQRGTVTATALDLALILSKKNIYLAGMDLSVKDIRSHTRPYGFDNLFFGASCRFSPVYSQSYIRSSLIKSGGSMDIYAAWFKNQLSSRPEKIFFLENNNIDTKGKKETYFKAVNVNEKAENFCKKGGSALINALKNSEYRSDIKKELTELLFPGRNDASLMELEKTIIEICEKASYE